jgi:hypothetical protein
VATGGIDGAGMAKLKTLEDAMTTLQRVHGLVEKLALTVKQGGSTSLFVMQIRRALDPLVGLLKPQFGMLADQVAMLNLAATRGGSEQMRVRALREGVGSLRQAFEIMERKVREQHTVDDARMSGDAE